MIIAVLTFLIEPWDLSKRIGRREGEKMRRKKGRKKKMLERGGKKRKKKKRRRGENGPRNGIDGCGLGSAGT